MPDALALVGRESRQLPLTDNTVSRRHCEIVPTEDEDDPIAWQPPDCRPEKSAAGRIPSHSTRYPHDLSTDPLYHAPRPPPSAAKLTPSAAHIHELDKKS